MPPLARLLRVSIRLGSAIALWALHDRGTERSHAGISRRLRIAAEALGPTFIKLGQILSSGRGIFPDELVDEFAKCRDQVPAEPFSTVRRVVEEDLGRPLEEVFASFDRTPVAAASIAQVHAAVLHSGESVVVKVQRPTVAERVHADLQVLGWLAPWLVGRIPVASLANPPALVDLFAETIVEELDFRLEAENMVDVATALVDLDQRTYVVPRPHPDLVTRRVLVMERLHGFAFDDVQAMVAGGVDPEAVVRTGMIASLEGTMFAGVFHGDLHFGNLLVLPDGRTGLLDFGITGRLAEPERVAFLRLLVAGTMNDVRGQLVALRSLGALPRATDIDAFISEVGLDQPLQDPTTMEADELIAELQRVVKALLAHGAHMPKELMLLVKNMVFVDGAIATLAPDLDLLAELQAISMHFAMTHGERIAGDVGLDPADWELDMDGMKASLGLGEEVTSLSHKELQGRRMLIRDRLARTRRPARGG